MEENHEKRITFLTQTETNYTPAHTGGEPCSACRWYGGEGFCNIVENYPQDIVSNGHCDRFEPVLQPGITIERDAMPEAEEMTEMELSERDFHTHETPETWGYLAPASNETGWLKAIRDKLRKTEVKTGSTIWRGADGQRYMLIVTSNGYKDRDNETLTTNSLSAYVDSCWKGEGIFHSDNPLLFWHWDKVKMGDIVYSDMYGTFLVEVARESDNPKTRPLTKMLWDHAETVKDAGASHRFGFYPSDRDEDGTFHRIRKQETSWLPREHAANYLTYSGVLPMSDKRREYLNKLTGVEDAADLLEKNMDELIRILAERGIHHKSDEKPEPQPNAQSKGWAILLNDIVEGMAEQNEQIETGNQKFAGLEKQLSGLAEAREKALNERDVRISKLESEVKALKDQLDARPRSAARSTETEIEEKNLPENVKNAMQEADPFWLNQAPKQGS